MFRNETILVIDDRRESVEFLTRYILQPAGYNIATARDGEEGLRKALDEEPDLIIMDLKMPKMGGLEVLQALHKTQSEIPVILMTFHGSEEAAVQAFRLGAKDYIIKPYQAQDMQRAVERALAESRLRRERDSLTESITAINRQMERQVKELGVLFSIGKSVTALLDQNRLLTRIVEAAVYITGAEEGFLLLVDEGSGELYMRAARGLGEKYARGFRLKVDDSLAGQVVRTGKPLMITGANQGDPLKVKTGYLVKSLLHVPIKVGDSVIGVLSVDHMVEDKAFDDHDLYLLSALADYAAIALENSRLYTELVQRLENISTEQPGAPAASERQEIVEQGHAFVDALREQVSHIEAWLEAFQSQRPLPPLVEPEARSAQGIEHNLADILDSIADGVLVIDQNGRVTLANKVAETILGRQVTGRPVDDVCDDPRWGKAYRVVETASQLDDNMPGCEIKGAVTPLNIMGKTFRASFRTMYSSDGGASQISADVIAILRDIDIEQEAQRAKDSFIASVSQELRTPVTSIIGYTDLLLGGSVGPVLETQAQFLSRVRANAERMGSMLNDLVSMTIIDSGQLAIQTEAIDIADIIKRAAGILRERFEEKEQSIELNLASNLPTAQADPDAVHHVVTSLLENALHCSPEQARIRLEANQVHEGQAQYISVSVTDAGGGVAPQDYKKVFNRYYRADNPTIPGLGAPGVGFSIVKVLVEAHGGRVWLESEPGVGTTFTFVLPTYRETTTR